MKHLIAAISILICAAAQAADAPKLKIAVLKFGTVNWLMNTISHNKLDEKHGYALDVVPLAGKAATTIALQSGDADAIVTDWVWAMRQHQEGVPYRFLPYSRALGALMVRPDAGIASICDLKGKSVGIAGGAIDVITEELDDEEVPAGALRVGGEGEAVLEGGELAEEALCRALALLHELLCPRQLGEAQCRLQFG